MGGKGNVQVDAGATLSTGGITMTNNLSLAASATSSVFKITGITPSEVDNLITTGASGTAVFLNGTLPGAGGSCAKTELATGVASTKKSEKAREM